jgi:hypothetical protein
MAVPVASQDRRASSTGTRRKTTIRLSRFPKPFTNLMPGLMTARPIDHSPSNRTNMTPETQNEIRAILALQKEIEAKKAEVSKRLAVICDRESEDTDMIVIDGELWKITRWGELRGPITAESFPAWCRNYQKNPSDSHPPYRPGSSSWRRGTECR